LGDDDGVKCELGIVKLVLGDVGNTDKDAAGGKQLTLARGSLMVENNEDLEKLAKEACKDAMLSRNAASCNANCRVRPPARRTVAHLHETDNQDDCGDGANQVHPPEALAVVNATALLSGGSNELRLILDVLVARHGCRL